MQNLIEKALNEPTVVKAMKYVDGATQPITDKLSYDQVEYSAKELNKAVKAIQEARKESTKPLDELKKELIQKEKEHTEPMIAAISEAKASMSKYLSELERKQQEVRQKQNEALERALQSDNPAQAIQQALTPDITLPTPKNVRTIRKVVVENENDVDWLAVIYCLIQADKFDYNVLLKGLLEAMDKTDTRAIKGISIVEERVQVLR